MRRVDRVPSHNKGRSNCHEFYYYSLGVKHFGFRCSSLLRSTHSILTSITTHSHYTTLHFKMLFTSLALSALAAVSAVTAHSKPNRARDAHDEYHQHVTRDLVERGLPGVSRLQALHFPLRSAADYSLFSLPLPVGITQQPFNRFSANYNETTTIKLAYASRLALFASICLSLPFSSCSDHYSLCRNGYTWWKSE